MKKELKIIIQKLSSIQIEALKNLYNHPDSVDQYNLRKYIGFTRGDILDTIHSRIKYWEFIHNNPEAIKGISEYQLGICSHIGFIMEEEWVKDYPSGVLDFWELIDKLYKNYHPELEFLNL